MGSDGGELTIRAPSADLIRQFLPSKRFYVSDFADNPKKQ
jgi:hypothetical protein